MLQAATLAGVYLGHRTTGDIDLFAHDRNDLRALVVPVSDFL